MTRNVRGCQGMRRDVKEWQEMPRNDYGCQGMRRYVMIRDTKKKKEFQGTTLDVQELLRIQRMTKDIRKWQEMSKVDKECQSSTRANN